MVHHIRRRRRLPNDPAPTLPHTPPPLTPHPPWDPKHQDTPNPRPDKAKTHPYPITGPSPPPKPQPNRDTGHHPLTGQRPQPSTPGRHYAHQPQPTIHKAQSPRTSPPTHLNTTQQPEPYGPTQHDQTLLISPQTKHPPTLTISNPSAPLQ
ncbi:proline-rich protein 2-like [Homalodisca vitripennis]|uniref:proline-rich protein 2-like n=1 Tax=Homalodisca vitripennis TaxID=197043 RepID=UPI001EECC784|nr:proline-rich protein 2-like [Homalodisca vitripennis]